MRGVGYVLLPLPFALLGLRVQCDNAREHAQVCASWELEARRCNHCKEALRDRPRGCTLNQGAR